MMTGTAEKKGGKGETGGFRSAARLGAVQALYQIDATGAGCDAVIDEFLTLRLGCEIDGDLYKAADRVFFTEIVAGASGRLAELDALLAPVLSKEWPLHRLEAIMKAMLRAGIYELAARPDVPVKVVINEYVDIAHAFYAGREPGFVNGILDRIARQLREGEERG